MTVDAQTWPLPRRSRTGPASSLDATAAAASADSLTPPRSRIFPWTMNMVATSRKTISTPLLIGPAILRKIFFSSGTITTPPQQSLELGWAKLVLTENAVPLATIRPYTVLTELQDPFGVTNIAIGKGLLADNTFSQIQPWERSLDLIVTEDRFCFTLSWINNSATAEQRGGHLLVLEAVNPEALAVFTGS